MKTLLYIFYFPLNTIWWLLNNVPLFKIKSYGFLFIRNKGQLVLGNGIVVNSNRYANIIGGATSSSFMVGPNARLELGNHVAMSNTTICCREEIIIEDHVMIGGGCCIWDTDFHPIDLSQRIIDPNSNYKNKPIRISSHAFIGAQSIILKGVTVGKNSVVGAGSVVRTSIPDNEIWAGNPAVFIKKLVE
jgi:acetyltransferase-like isoleucine patch superfamily enzyme